MMGKMIAGWTHPFGLRMAAICEVAMDAWSGVEKTGAMLFSAGELKTS
jgi:hypothetical protein